MVKELTSFGTYRYTASAKDGRGPFPPGSIRFFGECITSFDYAQNIIIIKTMPGLDLAAAASAVDAMNMSVVVGTLAGDDTVFLVMRDNNAAAAFCGEIKNLLA